MEKLMQGDIFNLVPKANIISDRLAYFKSNHPDFKYNVKLTIGKTSTLCLSTQKMNS